MENQKTCIIDGQECPINETFTEVLYNGIWREIFYRWDDDTYIIVNKRELYFEFEPEL